MILYTDSVCSWLSPTDVDDELECGDGKICHVGADLGWDCCQNNGRSKCPGNFPVMCAINSCGAQRDQYCCAKSVDKCREEYGVEARKCDSTRRLF